LDRLQIALMLTAGLALSACGGKQKAAHDPGGINTGLGSLEQHTLIPEPMPKYDQAKLDQLAAETLNLQALLAKLPEPEPTPAAAAPEQPKPPEPPPPTTTTQAPPAPAELITSALPPKPLSVRIEETGVALVDMLRQQATTDGSAKAYMALAGLELLRPGAFQTMITPSTTSGSTISPEDTAAVQHLRDYLAAIALEDAKEPLSKRLAAHVHLLTESASIAIRTVQLCSEVKGFGQYTSLPSSTFLAGQTMRAVVYAEVEHFKHREVNESDRLAYRLSGRELEDVWAVDLSEELQLYSKDGVRVWTRPEQNVVETSRNKRRDFYLVHTVSFPTTLTMGAYTLKVIVRDRVGGGSAEMNIPIEVVADVLASETRSP
jgi:hypothetical protein